MADQREPEEKQLLNNLGIVISQVLSVKSTRVTDRDDYIQSGTIGLLEAVRKYDPKKGKFSTFAFPTVWREIIREFKKFNDKTVSLEEEPLTETKENILDYVPDLSEVEQQVFIMKLQGFTLSEIGTEIGKSKEWVRQTIEKIILKIQNVN